jgi:hypothetical protein
LTLDRNAKQPRVLEHEGSEHGECRAGQIRRRIPGSGQVGDALPEHPKGPSGKGDDESILRAEDAVYGTCRRPRFVSDTPKGHGFRALRMKKAFGGVQERIRGSIAVLAWSAHRLTVYCNTVTLRRNITRQEIMRCEHWHNSGSR